MQHDLRLVPQGCLFLGGDAVTVKFLGAVRTSGEKVIAWSRTTEGALCYIRFCPLPILNTIQTIGIQVYFTFTFERIHPLVHKRILLLFFCYQVGGESD